MCFHDCNFILCCADTCIYVKCIKCILNDPYIVIESFEINLEVIQKIHLVPWPLSELPNVVLSVQV